MMAGLLREVGESSLSAAVMILAVLVLRLRFQDRTPRKVFCLLWDIVLLRLLVPGALPSPVSIRQWMANAGGQPAVAAHTSAADSAVEWVLVTGGTLTSQAAEITCLAEDTATAFETAPALPLLDWGAVLGALWLAAALLLAGGFLWSHLRSRKVYAASLPCRDGYVRDWLAAHPLYRPVQARVSDRIAAPLTYGVLYPVILLPRGMDWADREALACVLSHEHTHIQRFDALRKVFLAAALCLHWFDPLVWTMYGVANRDMELACDEAVLRGGADREQYALALLRMEERRGQWSPSGSHFSGHALEERIKAIMKRKHTSITALIVVLVGMCVTTTVFASGVPEGSPEKEPAQDQRALIASYVTPSEDDGTVIMSNGKTGEKEYSVDGGRTWMSEERYQAEYGDWGDGWQVEWWTYEDYKAWLEQEKKDLQGLIGEHAYTGSRGWFPWDQAMVDETIALYEDILEGIKNGALYSRTIVDKNGSEVEDVALGSDGPVTAFVEALTDDSLLVERENAHFDAAALLEELKNFGIVGDEKQLTYSGQLIRCLVDGAPVGDNGYSIQYVHVNDRGTVDIHTLRSVVRSPDGSYDVMGDLIGVVSAGDQGFDPKLIEAAAFSRRPQTATNVTVGKDGDQGAIQASVAEGTGEGGTSFEEIFARYGGYGLTYLPREGGMGALSYNGQPVRFFADLKPNGSAFSYQDPYAQEGLTVCAEYDRDGNLAALFAGPPAEKDYRTTQQALGFDYTAPVQGHISAGFGETSGRFHYGVDLAAEKGTDVTAFAGGVVSEIGFTASLGNYVILSHEGGYTTLYAHCGSIAASMGASVAIGEKIAEVGASGAATGPVLHFELRDGEAHLDPAQYLDDTI